MRGESLDRLAKTLSHDWLAEEKRWVRKRPDIKAAFDRVNREEAIDRFMWQAADVVYDYLQEIGVQRPGSAYDTLVKSFSNLEFIDEVLRLLRKGYSPVVVITGKETKVIPDFLLASVADDPNSQGRPLIIMPIREAFLHAFREANPELRKVPKYTPAMRVVEHGNNRRRQRKYRHKGPWEFALEE
jgi:hypothetical protein